MASRQTHAPLQKSPPFVPPTVVPTPQKEEPVPEVTKMNFVNSSDCVCCILHKMIEDKTAFLELEKSETDKAKLIRELDLLILIKKNIGKIIP